MSDNVKIKIQEYDKTRPFSTSTDSTDIPFIPGFTFKKDATFNTPILCTTVKEFTTAFGDQPAFIDGKPDISYVFAKELLFEGMSVVYAALLPKTETSTDAKDAFKSGESIEDVLSLISDKSLYSVKYITTGGYPSLQIDTGKYDSGYTQQLLTAASSRNDCVALVDYPLAQDYTSGPKIYDEDKKNPGVYQMIRSAVSSCTSLEFGTAMCPWGLYDCSRTLSGVTYDGEEVATELAMPGSFGYLMCVARAIKTSPNWLAMAGVSRGLVPNLKQLLVPGEQISNKIAEDMQPKAGRQESDVSVNCITDIKPYGLTLWGNRTLKTMNAEEGTTSLHFLNIRNMLSDIKKVLYTTAKSLMFEQNSDTLWLRFKAGVSPLLNQLKTGNGISDFKIIKLDTNYEGERLSRGEMAAVIKIYPMYAVEYFELTVEISDDDVTIS